MTGKTEVEKFSHQEVDYEEKSTHPGKICGNCKHFIPGSPPACEGVKKPISIGAFCGRYDAVINTNPVNYSKTPYQLAHKK